MLIWKYLYTKIILFIRTINLGNTGSLIIKTSDTVRSLICLRACSKLQDPTKDTTVLIVIN